MTEPTNVVRFRQPDDVDGPLTEVLRAGARRLLAQAVKLEAEAFLADRDALRCCATIWVRERDDLDENR